MASENATVLTFGYPGTLVAEYPAWFVLLRPQQATAGALVLAHRGDATAFSALPATAYAGLQQAIGDIERNLKSLVHYERINYLMLMMVDPHVHFHVLPRYSGSRTLGGLDVMDHGWPRAPDLTKFAQPEPAVLADIARTLRSSWARG